MEDNSWFKKIVTCKDMLLFFILCIIGGCSCKQEITVSKAEIYSKLGETVSIIYKIEDNTGSRVPTPKTDSIFEIAAVENKTTTRLVTISFKSSQPAVTYDTDNNDLKESYKNRITVTYKDNEVSFTLKNITATDFGRSYQTEYLYTLFKRPKNAVKLIKAVKPTIINASFFPRVMQIRGKSAEYMCLAEGQPTPQVKWLRNNILQAEGSEKAIMTISQAQIEDSDEYVCVALNPGGETNQTMTLTVPYIEVRDNVDIKYTTIPLGGRINEPCEVLGHPTPTYKWYNTKQKVEEETQNLEFSNFQEFGNYTCVGSNAAGKASYTLHVSEARQGSGTTATTAENHGVSSATLIHPPPALFFKMNMCVALYLLLGFL